MTAGRRPGPRRRLTDADIVALVVLLDGPAHGGAIWNRLSDCDVEDWATASRAQVYYSLGKLARQELVRAAADEGDSKRSQGRRTPWRITAEGRRAVTAALSSRHWAAERAVSPFTTWVALSELAQPAARRRIIDDRRRLREAELERKRKTVADAQQLPPEMPGVQVTIVMVNHVIARIELELELLKALGRLFAR